MQRRKFLTGALGVGSRVSVCLCAVCSRRWLFAPFLGGAAAMLPGCGGSEDAAAPPSAQPPGSPPSSPTPTPTPTPNPPPPPPPPPPPGASRYRLISVNPAANPFKGTGDGAAYGGAKHVMWQWHPGKKRVYTWGGDFGVGAAAFGQPDMGASFTANGRSYQRDSSLNNDQYSIDPYAGGTPSWRLEHPYLPRNLGGAREARPGRPDQVSLVWDPARNKFWGFITAVRSEFVYFNGGVPDLWANGDITTNGAVEPTGTWSWVPSDNGGAGTWTYETDALVVCRGAGGTQYVGNVLATQSHDERVAYWERDPMSDRVVAFGSGRIFIFNPATKTYEHRTFFPAGYNYFNPCSSQCAVVNGWMYGVALVRQGSTQRSVLIRVHIPTMLAQPNGGSIPDNASSWEAFTLPWSLSPGRVWENNNNASAKWQEHAGVVAIDDKVAVVCSYDNLLENGVTKLAIFATGTRQFTPGDAAPEAISANAWVALPDTGEVMFGLNSGNYPNGRVWAYRVRG